MTTETPSVDEARSAVWAAYYEVQAGVQNQGTPAPDMLRAIATFEAAIIRERNEAMALLRSITHEAERVGQWVQRMEAISGEPYPARIPDADGLRDLIEPARAFLSRFPATPEEGRRDE